MTCGSGAPRDTLPRGALVARHGYSGGDLTSWRHEQRLDAVLDAVRQAGARSVLDLGCGAGDLILRLLQEPQIDRILGIDQDRAALQTLQAHVRVLRARDADRGGPDLALVAGSLLEAGRELRGFDCVVLVEVLEHLEPERLSVLERAVFRHIAAPHVILTTPNADFNAALGVPSHRFRHPDHKFEWGGRRFRSWAEGVARRHGYSVHASDIAAVHPTPGSASQMAVFVHAA